MEKIDEIRNAIAEKIAAVPNIGRVHTFERFSASEKGFRALYESVGRVLGWNVRRVAKKVRRENGMWVHIHTWGIKGFSGIDDAAESELVFDRLVEAVGEAFRSDVNLGGIVESTEDGETSGIQVEDSGPVMFSGVLCHSARLKLVTRHSSFAP